MNSPHRSFGSGKIVRSDSYGHVEVSISPLLASSDLHVEWQARGESIPANQRETVIAAAKGLLEFLARQGQLRCGVQLTIEYGSYHEESISTHVEAAELATMDALKRGDFIREN